MNCDFFPTLCYVSPLLCLICGVKTCSNENHENFHGGQSAFINTETTMVTIKYKDNYYIMGFAYNNSLGEPYYYLKMNFEDFKLNYNLISKVQNIVLNHKIAEMVYSDKIDYY